MDIKINLEDLFDDMLTIEQQRSFLKRQLARLNHREQAELLNDVFADRLPTIVEEADEYGYF